MPAGSVNGVWDLDAVLADGRRAGWQRRACWAHRGASRPAPADALPSQISHPWPIFPHPQGKDFVDFDEDLTGQGHPERGPRWLRRRPAAQALLHARHGAEPGPALERRRDRPARRGHRRRASRRSAPPRRGRPSCRRSSRTSPGAASSRCATAMHHRHLELGARMMVGGRLAAPGLLRREGRCRGADRGRGPQLPRQRRPDRRLDARRLEVRGPTRPSSCERIYTFNLPKQEVGRARYALMCDKAGVIVDDGVACRLHERHFYVTATTGVDAVYRQMLWWNAQWRLDVDVTNVTAAASYRRRYRCARGTRPRPSLAARPGSRRR